MRFFHDRDGDVDAADKALAPSHSKKYKNPTGTRIMDNGSSVSFEQWFQRSNASTFWSWKAKNGAYLKFVLPQHE
jgi:hypothetical protein